MAIGDVLTLHAQWHQTNGVLIAENQFHFSQVSVLVFDTPAEDLHDAFINQAEPALVACVSGQWSLINYRIVSQPSGLTVAEFAVDDHSGALTGDALPPQVSTLMSFRTAHPGRTGKGRVYLPPANEANSGLIGTPSTTLVGLVTALGAALMDMHSESIEYAGWDWGVWSEKDQAFYKATSVSNRYRFMTRKSRAT